MGVLHGQRPTCLVVHPPQGRSQEGTERAISGTAALGVHAIAAFRRLVSGGRLEGAGGGLCRAHAVSVCCWCRLVLSHLLGLPFQPIALALGTI